MSTTNMTDEEQLSLIVSEALDVLGYRQDMVKERRVFCDKLTELETFIEQKDDANRYITISGSMREGLAGWMESDLDMMVTDPSVQCTDNPASVTRDVRYIFELERQDVPHGYTKLRLAYRDYNNVWDFIENCLVGCGNGELYLSNELLISQLEHMSSDGPDGAIAFKPRAGPSVPSKSVFFPTLRLDVDAVPSFPCQCSEYLQDWFNRPRHYDWPSLIQIGNISALDAHVVPVGAKGSMDASVQWRICFTLAEVMLMQSLNETQWKLYKLLKMIKDDLLQPLGDLVTSYVLKNVVMWICEINPLEQFQPIYLLKKLQQSLFFLFLCLWTENMPSYMIRQRNLFQGRINEDNRKEYLKVVYQLLKDGRAMVIRCPKLRETMIQVYTDPEEARAEMESRDGAELLTIDLFDMSPEEYADFYTMIGQCSNQKEAIIAIADFMASNAEIVALHCDCEPEDITRETMISFMGEACDDDSFMRRVSRK